MVEREGLDMIDWAAAIIIGIILAVIGYIMKHHVANNIVQVVGLALLVIGIIVFLIGIAFMIIAYI